MAITVRIVHAGDWIRATAAGILDLAQSERLLDEIATASNTLTDFSVILDTRRAETTLSVTDLWYVATYAASLPEMRGLKIAVLPPAENFDRATFFATVARNRGMRIHAFESFEDAVDWLTAGQVTS